MTEAAPPRRRLALCVFTRPEPMLAALPGLLAAGISPADMAIVGPNGAAMPGALASAQARQSKQAAVPGWSRDQLTDLVMRLDGTSGERLASKLSPETHILLVWLAGLKEEAAVSPLLLASGAQSIQFHDLAA